MAEESSRKTVKVGVRVGEGPPPGYQWNVEILDLAWKEAHELLNEDQYSHVAAQFRELARHEDPTRSPTLDLDRIEDFHELRDKGGVLKKLNVRVFYFVHKPTRSIVVLGVIHKQNDGATPLGDKVRARMRKRHYLESLETG